MDEKALSKALVILNKLGERIDPRQSIAVSDILQTKSRVEESINSIIEMKEITDKRLLTMIEILNTIAYASFKSGKRQLYASLTLKMVDLSLMQCISKYSSPAICNFAILLHSIEDKSSYVIGKLSLKLLEKLKSKELIPAVNCSFYSMISPFYSPLRKDLDSLRRTAVVSIEISSHHFTKMNIASYSLPYFFCGKPLLKLLDKLSEFEGVLVQRTKLDLSVH